MKLFKSLLVAPAALGLLAPMSAMANEVNLDGISNYSDVESIDFANSFNNEESSTEGPMLAGGEGLIDDLGPSGGFSDTTTASFSADFYIGAQNDDVKTDDDEAVGATYSFQIDLNTSFTGEDSLDVSIDAGNSSSTIDATQEFDGNATADRLEVDGVSYTFPLGDKTTMIVGDNTDGSALFTTACVYGGPGNMLDDCANVNAGITGGGATFGASYDFGNGFTSAFGYQGTNSSLATDEGADSYALNAAYTGEDYGVSVTFSKVDSTTTSGATDDEEDTYTAFNAYYAPEGFPSISVGYETGDIGGAASTVDSQESFFIGLSSELGSGEFGVAMGHSNTVEGSSEEYQYEAYYSYPINDGMTVTPLVFTKENSTAGLDDTTGVMVKTSFSF